MSLMIRFFQNLCLVWQIVLFCTLLLFIYYKLLVWGLLYHVKTLHFDLKAFTFSPTLLVQLKTPFTFIFTFRYQVNMDRSCGKSSFYRHWNQWLFISFTRFTFSIIIENLISASRRCFVCILMSWKNFCVSNINIYL